MIPYLPSFEAEWYILGHIMLSHDAYVIHNCFFNYVLNMSPTTSKLANIEAYEQTVESK